jgi:hypothetical protein
LRKIRRTKIRTRHRTICPTCQFVTGDASLVAQALVSWTSALWRALRSYRGVYGECQSVLSGTSDFISAGLGKRSALTVALKLRCFRVGLWRWRGQFWSVC